MIDRLIQQPVFQSLLCSGHSKSVKYNYKLGLILPLHRFQPSSYMAQRIGGRKGVIENEHKVSDLGNQ